MYPHTGRVMPFDAATSVNGSTTFSTATELGKHLRAARRSLRLSQQNVAEHARVDLATLRGLERGRGTVGPLVAILHVIQHRFHHQPPECELGPWLATVRKAAGLSQKALAVRSGVTKPTVIQVERGRGNLASLLAVMRELRLGVTLAPIRDPLHGTRLVLGDCMEVMPTLPDHSIHLVIADLPYQVGDLPWDKQLDLDQLWTQLRRLMTPTGVAIFTATQPFTTTLAASNLPWLKYSLVWEKTRVTGFLHAKQKPLKKHEDILVFSPGATVYEGRSRRPMTYNPQGLVELEKPVRARRDRNGQPVLFNGKRVVGRTRVQTHTNYPTSVLKFPSEPRPVHPTQKPVELVRYLIRTYSNAGDTVLDPCFGSGTTAVAAVLEGRKFVGSEKDPRYIEIAHKRVLQVGADRGDDPVGSLRDPPS